VTLEHPGHQSINGAARGRDLLKDGAAVRAFLERTFKGVNLTLYTANTGQDSLFLFCGVRHFHHQWILEGSNSIILEGSMGSGRRTPNDIVTAAALVLAEEGYANFTQARIATKLGLLPSSLRNYFPTREDLFVYTIGALMNTYLDRYLEMGRPSDKSPMRHLCEIVVDVFDEVCDPRVRRFSLEMFAVIQHSERSHEVFRRVYATYRSIYADLIREIDPTASARECLVRATLIAARRAYERPTVVPLPAHKKTTDYASSAIGP
jgi:AcrR family transcriptional regulator